MPDSLGKSFDAAQKDLDAPGRGKDTGTEFVKGTRDGVDEESQRESPFSGLIASFKSMFKGFGDQSRRELPDIIDDSVDQAVIDADMPGKGDDAGTGFTRGFQRAIDRDTKKRSPFKTLVGSFQSTLKKLTAFPSGKFAWATTLGVPAIAGAAKLITGYLGGVVALLGNVVTAAAGTGVALLGLGVTLAPAFAALTLGLKTDSDLLKEFTDDMEDVAEQWEAFGKSVQKGLLPALTKSAKRLGVFLPMLTDYGTAIGEIAGRTAEWAAAALTSQENQKAWSAVMLNSERVTTTFGQIIVRLADALPKLFAAAAPIAADFLDSINGLVARFQTFIDTASESGALSETFELWWERAKRLGRILGNVADGLWQIFKIGADAADPLLKRMERITEHFQDWARSRRGKRQIAEFFENAMPVMREVNRLFGALIRMIGAPILTGDTGGVVSFLRWIRTDILPILQDFGTAVGDMGLSRESIQTFVEALLGITKLAVESGSMQGFLDTLTLLLEVLKKLVELPGVGKMAGELLYFAGALKALNIVTAGGAGKLLATVLGDIAGGFLGLAGATGPLATFGAALAPVVAVLAALAVVIGLVWSVWTYWEQIVDGLETAWEAFDKLSTPIKVVATLLGGPFLVALAVAIGPLVAFVGAVLGVVAALKNWTEIAAWLDDAWDAIWEFFTGLPELISGVIGDLLSNLDELGGVLTDFAASIPERLSEGLSSLTGLASDLATALGDLLLDALAELPDIGVDFGQWLLDQLVNGLSALGDLGVALGEALYNTFISGIGVLTEWAVALPALIGTWVLSRIADLWQIGTEILGAIVIAITENLPGLGIFFLTLPIKIANWIVEGLWALAQVGGRIIASILGGIPEAADAMFDLGVDLIVALAKGIAKAVPALFGLGVDLLIAIGKGLEWALPKVIDFFRKLPGRMLRAAITGFNILFDLGKSIMEGLGRGISTGAEAIWTFLQSIPRRIIDFFSTTGSWLLEAGKNLVGGFVAGAKEVFASIDDLFGGLPQRIWDLVSRGIPALARLGWRIVRFIFNGIREGAAGLFDFFRGLPGRIVGLISAGLGRLAGAGRRLLNMVLSGVRSVAENIWSFFRQLPGGLAERIIGGLGRLLGAGRRILGSILDGIRAVISNIWEWARGLPGNLADRIINNLGRLLGAGGKIISKIKEGIESTLHEIKDWAYDLPGNIGDWILTFVGDVASAGASIGGAIWDALKGALNAIEFTIDFTFPSFSAFGRTVGGQHVHFTVDPIPDLAQGIIVPGMSGGLLARIGEAGAEALIPLTRPARAMDLMRQSGLLDLARTAPEMNAVAGETTLIKIENAMFMSPVDLDLLLAKVPSAYHVMTGRAGWR